MLIAVRHVTRYSYADAARHAISTLRLEPANHRGQSVLQWAVEAPGAASAVRFRDGYGNAAMLVTALPPPRAVEIVARGLVETRDTNGVVEGLPERTPRRVFQRQTPLTAPDEAIIAIADASRRAAPLEMLHALMIAVRHRLDYRVNATTPATTAASALQLGAGVCQDYTHVFLSAARHLEVPARYVTGYYLSGADGPEAAHHAWAEAFVEPLGWVGFDCTNGICPDERYVRLAAGLDAISASPIRGRRLLGAQADADERLDVHVEVQQQQVQSQQ